MTLFTQERMHTLIDEIASGKSVSQASALAYGSRSKVAWVHFRNAKRDREAGMDMMASPYHLENWPDEGEHHWLDHAYQMAVQIAKLDFHHEVLAEIRQSTRPVLTDGGVMYEKDPFLLAKFKDAEEAAWFGYDDWPYRHDASGARIELRVRDRTSAALTIAALKAEYGERWAVPETINVNKKTIAVLTLGERKTEKPQSALEQDLRSRLAAVLAAKEGERVTKPNAPIPRFTADTSDPPERLSTPHSDDASRPLPPEPPRALPPPQPQVSYARPARPNNNLDRQDAPNHGAPPPGGFRVR
jgi:hypothetical protein